jgi:uncharacterized protein
MALARCVFLLALFTICITAAASAPSPAGEFTDALKAKDLAQVRELIAAGADMNEKVRGDYPLNIAATFGPVEMVALVLETGVDIERPGRDGLRPLHNAVITGSREIVRFLIGKGAKVNSRDSRGRTPLLWFAAIAGSDIEIAKLLLAAGAGPEIEETDDLLRALDFAAINGNLELAKLLLTAGSDVNRRQSRFWGETALMHAIFHDHLEMVQLLITHGADVNLANKQGQSPLHYAAGKPEMRRLLIDAGAK